MEPIKKALRNLLHRSLEFSLKGLESFLSTVRFYEAFESPIQIVPNKDFELKMND